jgi:hypothetical protein
MILFDQTMSARRIVNRFNDWGAHATVNGRRTGRRPAPGHSPEENRFFLKTEVTKF